MLEKIWRLHIAPKEESRTTAESGKIAIHMFSFWASPSRIFTDTLHSLPILFTKIYKISMRTSRTWRLLSTSAPKLFYETVKSRVTLQLLRSSGPTEIAVLRLVKSTSLVYIRGLFVHSMYRVLLFSLVGHFDTEIDAICCTFCYARLFDRSILTKENFESDVPFHSPFKKAGVSLR